MNSKEINKIKFIILQISIGRITNSIASISYKVDSENINSITLFVTVIENIQEYEKGNLRIFHSLLIKELPSFKINYRLKSVSKIDFETLNFETLDNVIFLKHRKDA
jgi:hypothetical protein